MLERYIQEVPRLDCFRRTGEVTELVGLLVQSRGPDAPIGSFCEIETLSGPVRAQVVGFSNGKTLCMPMEEIHGVQLGNAVVAREAAARIPVGPSLLGRVLDGFGQPMDGGPPLSAEASYDIHTVPVGPLQRRRIDRQLVTGVRAVDGLLACGEGQRIGLFGGSGVGKSTLVGSIARHNAADVTVLAIHLSRGRAKA